MKRKQFGVPFSGIEILQFPFLRQFAKLNMDLHSEFKRDDEEDSKTKEEQKSRQEASNEYQKLKGT